MTASHAGSYGYDSDRIRRRCRLHKLPDMVDVKSPRCETPGCKKQPCCGHLGAKARFCSEHKQDGMVNLKVIGSRLAPDSSACYLVAEKGYMLSLAFPSTRREIGCFAPCVLLGPCNAGLAPGELGRRLPDGLGDAALCLV